MRQKEIHSAIGNVQRDIKETLREREKERESISFILADFFLKLKEKNGFAMRRVKKKGSYIKLTFGKKQEMDSLLSQHIFTHTLRPRKKRAFIP